MARGNKKITDFLYYANHDNTQLTAEERAVFEAAGSPQQGYYQYVSLDDVVNNFIVNYIGEDKLIRRARKSDVQFHAQRGLAKMTFDAIPNICSKIEVQLGPSLTIPFPSDCIKVNKIAFVDGSGLRHELKEEHRQTANSPYRQDDQYEYIYDNTDNVIQDEKGVGQERWQYEADFTTEARQALAGLFGGGNGAFDSSGNLLVDRFGLDPVTSQLNGTYLLDELRGTINFNSQYQEGDIIDIDYLSDGLGNNADLTKVNVHKLFEDPLYAYMAWQLAMGRAYISESRVETLKRQKNGEFSTARIRIGKFAPNDLIQHLRGKAKWIKH